MQSRLKKNQEKQAIVNILGIILLTIIIIVILFVYGIPLLINFSLTVEKLNKSNQSANQLDNSSYLEPPTLNPTFTATNSASVTISGYASPSQTNQSINLYVNDKLADKTTVKADKTFSFANILLKPGQNSIKARATSNRGAESADSNAISILYTDKKPALSVDSPQDNQAFSKDQNTITVKGSTDPGDKVTVNSFWAIVDNQGKFSYTIKLQNGDNQIKIISSDDAGNQIEKDIKITYSQ